MFIPIPASVRARLLAVTDGELANIPDVVHRLTVVQETVDRLPNLFGENPVADFNNLYTAITSRILAYHEQGRFRAAEFLTVLDIEFAKRYLVALRRWADNSPNTPEAWMVLFGRFDDARLRSLPCAVAGVNAHINFDLPFAVVETWQRLGFSPTGSDQHHDYLSINDVFHDEIPLLRRSYLGRWQRIVDTLNGGLDDWYQNALVQVSRDRAWENAMRIWEVRANDAAVERIRSQLDRQTARLGRVVLSRLGALLQ